jgi:hypothetical protein
MGRSFGGVVDPPPPTDPCSFPGGRTGSEITFPGGFSPPLTGPIIGPHSTPIGHSIGGDLFGVDNSCSEFCCENGDFDGSGVQGPRWVISHISLNISGVIVTPGTPGPTCSIIWLIKDGGNSTATHCGVNSPGKDGGGGLITLKKPLGGTTTIGGSSTGGVFILLGVGIAKFHSNRKYMFFLLTPNKKPCFCRIV